MAPQRGIVIAVSACWLMSIFAADTSAAERASRKRGIDPIKAGMLAPDFDLTRLEYIGKKADENREAEKGDKDNEKKTTSRTVKLSSFRDNKSVLLIFSSYT